MASRDTYLNPYRESVATHGPRFEATLWASVETQTLRFNVFMEMFPLAGCRILDCGCSRGDFAPYLLEHGVEYAHFVGVDALDEVINFAAQREIPRAEFVCGDALANPMLLRTGKPDVICISGTMNTMQESQALRLLESCWASTKKALLFNFLSGRAGRRAPPHQPPVVRFDPLRMLEWALKQTPFVAYRQDYFRAGHDASILMTRSPLPTT